MSSQSKLTLAVAAAAVLVSACKDTVVKVVEVASVQVSAANGTIVLNGTTQFSATPRDDRNNVLANRPISWSSSNTAVATVDAAGLVRGTGAGSATINATVEGVAGNASIAVNNPVPTVSSLNPAIVIAGTATFDITVTGTGFVQNAVVLWNDQPRQTTFVSATTLRASILTTDIATSGRFNVSVRNPTPGGGNSANSAVDIHNPLPTVTALSPGFVLIGGAQFDLVVTGTGFVAGAVAYWNQQARTTQVVNPTTLRMTIPASDVVAAGNINITVQNPSPGGGVSTARAFEVRNPVPVVNTLSPNNVVFGATGFEITITGTGFVQNSQVRWNGQTRTTTYVSGTLIRATIPAADVAAPALVDVTVDNPTPGGGPSSARQFISRINAPGFAIAARRYHSCANRANGETYCWGLNDGGQLGDGTTTDRLTPTRVQTTLPFVSVVAGYWHACGLTSWGAAYCWGTNTVALGRGSGGSSLTPVLVTGNHAFVQLAAGAEHTCGVTAAQLLYCWGQNWLGQVGDNSNNATAMPVAVGATAQRWRSVFTGEHHTCALTTASQIYCWGYNSDGQLGDGTTMNRNGPVLAASGATWTTGTAGSRHTCAVAISGFASCWGAGYAGQLGNGNWSSSSAPVTVLGGIGYRTMSATYEHTCAVTNNGATYCWGRGGDGQLGDGQVAYSNTPVLVNVPPARQVAAGEMHTCVLGTNNLAYCWGDRTFGTLGDGVAAVRAAPANVTSAASGYTAVATGLDFTCGLSGTAPRCWGTNGNYELGDNTNTNRPIPTTVSGNHSFVSIATGNFHACGLTAAGAAYCWGAGGDGRLGNGASFSAGAPLPVGGGNVFREITVGGNHSCGLTTAGIVRCWGYNGFGQLGDGTTAAKSFPTAIAAPAGVTFNTVSAGEAHTCAVSTAGQLYCWGLNGSGRLGDGSTIDKLSPVLIALGAPVQRVAAGYFHSCALTTTGAAYCWGWNGWGELGRGTWSGNEPTPAAVVGGRTFRTISAGLQVSCGVTTADEAFCWGGNWWGQLGIGNVSGINTPSAVVGGTGYADVRTKFNHTCGVTTGGAVRCWGRSRVGELGINVVGVMPTPALVPGGFVFDGSTCGLDDCGLVVPTGDMSPFLRLPPRPLFGGANAGVRHIAPAPRLAPIEPVACRPDQLCPRVPLRIR